MECNQLLISAYLDEELEPSATAAFAQHLFDCAACTQAHHELQQLRQRLNTDATQFSAPVHLRYRIQADLDALKVRNQPVPTFSRNWMVAGLTSMSTLALAVSLALYIAIPRPADILNQEIVASHYRSLLVSHMTDVVSSDHHTVKPWFTGKLDYAPTVQDFAAEGFTLLGGRLDYINKHTVAALAYRHNNHLINVFMWPEKTGPLESTIVLQGFNLLKWHSNGMTYVAVSDMNEHEMVRLRQLFIEHSDN